MISAENLIWNFEMDANYVRNLLADLTHADSLVQPPASGNCINWILGHIVCYRNYAMSMCNLPSVVASEVAQRYARDSAPVQGPTVDVADFDLLFSAYQQSHQQLMTYLQDSSVEVLSEIVTAAGFTMPRGELLTSFMRHESYHAGQFELLREWVLAQR